MFVVSLALAAVLVASSSDSDAGPSEATAGETPSPGDPAATRTPPSTRAPEPTPAPPLPAELQERVNALPEKLRNETLLAYATGALSPAQVEQIATDFENRNPAVRVGSVIAAGEATLRFEVFTTGETAEVAILEHTLIRRGPTDIALADLLANELVMIVTTDEGASALTIEAFGVAAP